MNVLIFFDGVMSHRFAAPIVQGVALFRSLQTHRRTVILCKEREKTEKWLRDNNILKIDDLVSAEEIGVSKDLELIEYCRSKGKIDVVVTSDITLSTKLLEAGIPTLLFLDPKYTRPEFRPDAPKGVKSWEELQTEKDRQEELYREDPRANEDHIFGG